MLSEKDFCNWAEEYTAEAKVLEKLIEEKQKKSRAAKASEMSIIKHSLYILKAAYRECTDNAAALLKKAEKAKNCTDITV